MPDTRARLDAMQRANRLARHVVRVHWPLIDALAAHLERDRRLSGAHVLRIIQAHQEARR